jgi:hypothetical protein
MEHTTNTEPTPYMSAEEELEKWREFAKKMHQMYVNESWWTQMSEAFLFTACGGLAVTLFLLWFSMPDVLQNKIPVGVYIWLGASLILLVMHIQSRRHIHRRFQQEMPEDYHIWRTGTIPPKQEDNWSSNIGDAVKIYD